MRLWEGGDLAKKEVAFEVVASTDLSQFAVMALQSGETSGDFGNEHAGSDQWLIVLEGHGEAKGESETHKIGPGDVVLVPAPEKHQFRNTGKTILKTVSFYAPIAYRIEPSGT